MRINVGLRRLLRVKVGARRIGGAVVELDDMFAGLTGGSNLKHRAALSGDRGDFTGIFVVVPERHKLLETAPSDSFHGDCNRRAYGPGLGSKAGAAQSTKAAARYVAAFDNGEYIMDFAEIFRRSEFCIHPPVSIRPSAAQDDT